MDAASDPVTAIAVPVVNPTACGPEPARLEDALAARPDVRAAEIAIEAAAQRARWEHSRVLTFIGILDGNGTGASANLGPGVNADIPISRATRVRLAAPRLKSIEPDINTQRSGAGHR